MSYTFQLLNPSNEEVLQVLRPYGEVFSEVELNTVQTRALVNVMGEDGLLSLQGKEGEEVSELLENALIEMEACTWREEVEVPAKVVELLLEVSNICPEGVWNIVEN